MRFNPAEELDIQAAHQIIREIVVSGTIVLSKHAKERMKERGYSTHDIEHILLNGKIIKKEFKNITNTWVYTVNGNDLDGDCGSVVTAIDKRMYGIVITVLS